MISSVVLYLLVPVLPEWFARIRVLIAPAYLNIPYYWTAVFSLFALILLVPVALMGMNLPLIFNYLRSRGLFLSQTVGRIYAVNTLGSVLGSLIGGYLLFYWLTWDGVFRFNLVLIALTLPFIVALAGRGRRLAALAAVLPLVVVFALPRWDDHAFLPAATNINRTARRIKAWNRAWSGFAKAPRWTSPITVRPRISAWSGAMAPRRCTSTAIPTPASRTGSCAP